MSEAIRSVEPLGRPWRTQDPFLFCMYHLDDYPAGDGSFGPAPGVSGRNLGMDFDNIDGWNMYHGHKVPGFPAHPHRGFETITVVRKGLVDHSDSLGAAGRYGNGDVQWLTAGSGVVHAEMFPLLSDDEPNPLDLFQIWLNLPATDKFVAPHFTMLWGRSIPTVTTTDEAGASTSVQVIAGAIGEHAPPAPPPNSWASKPQSDVAVWLITMEPGASWTLPATDAGTNRSLFFYSGEGLSIAGTDIPARSGVEVRPDGPLELVAGASGAGVLLLQGAPIGDPVVQAGPFVMNSREQIIEAFADYDRTRFGGWPWPTTSPVHGRKERFARHADGSEEDGK